MGAEGDLVAPRLARGVRCFVVWIEGAIAGYGWLSSAREWIGEVQLEITPAPGQGYVWNCVTVSEHRRKGVFRSLLHGISAAARKQGFRRLWLGSMAIPAERAVGPAGFRPALRMLSVTGAGLRLVWVAAASDHGLATDALKALSASAGISVRRSRRVRH